MQNSGTLVIISAPSGAGKTSLVTAVSKRLQNIVISTSYTTRAPRAKEQHGQDYYFVDDITFKAMVKQHMFLEYAQVFSHFYGTAIDTVTKQLASGKDVILEIDWQGAKQIATKLAKIVKIFILPPSLQILRLRLQQRQQDSGAVIAQRLAQAVTDIQQYQNYDYVVVNNCYEQAVAEIQAIIQANRVRLSNNAQDIKNLVQQMLTEGN